MDELVQTTVAEVQAAIGGMNQYAADPASDGMSVELRWFPPSGLRAGQRVSEAYALISRLSAAGYWVADTETYWNAQASGLLADGKPVWVGRQAAAVYRALDDARESREGPGGDA